VCWASSGPVANGASYAFRPGDGREQRYVEVHRFGGQAAERRVGIVAHDLGFGDPTVISLRWNTWLVLGRSGLAGQDWADVAGVHRCLRQINLAWRPNTGRSTSSTSGRSLTRARPPQPSHCGGSTRASTKTSNGVVSTTPRTATSGRPTSSSQARVTQDGLRCSGA
jgi:hypothetical protein